VSNGGGCAPVRPPQVPERRARSNDDAGWVLLPRTGGPYIDVRCSALTRHDRGHTDADPNQHDRYDNRLPASAARRPVVVCYARQLMVSVHWRLAIALVQRRTIPRRSQLPPDRAQGSAQAHGQKVGAALAVRKRPEPDEPTLWVLNGAPEANTSPRRAASIDLGLRRGRFKPGIDDLRPNFGAVTMQEVTAASDLAVCPTWMASQRSACKGDRHDVVSIAVDDQQGTAHVVSDSVEPVGRVRPDRGHHDELDGVVASCVPRRVRNKHGGGDSQRRLQQRCGRHGPVERTHW
jgi:hypothetical protein